MLLSPIDSENIVIDARASDIDVNGAKSMSKDSTTNAHESAAEKHQEEENIDFGTNEPIVDDEISEERNRQKQQLLQKMNTKKQAIYRSLLHLSDNSYSFVYDDSNKGQKTSTMNDDDEPGLPFIGPGLKDQYEELRLLLRKGLLGHTDDVEDNETSRVKSNGDKNEDNGRFDDSHNPFLPRIKSNVSAVLMGERGHGKTLVLERCLASLSRLAGKRKERILEHTNRGTDNVEEMYSQASFRVVRLNGLLYQGDSAVACTREIARQIGVMSREERKRTRKIMKQMGTKRNRLQTSELDTPKSKKQRKKERSVRRSQKKLSMTSPDTPLLPEQLTQTPDNPTSNNESHNLRIRQSGFNTYIALLDEVLRTARIDGIPILIVLEELDTFIAGGRSASVHNMASDDGNMQHDDGSNARQLLLYHLLDRVADHKFLVSLVGITTDLTTVTKLEKRVQSRAEGTSKIIYFGHDKGYDDLVKSLLGKFYTPPDTGESDIKDEYNEQKAMHDIREEVETILRGGKSESDLNQENDQEVNDFELVQRVLQRNYELIGSDMKWLCRVFDVALSLLASDIDEHIYQCMENAADDPKFNAVDCGMIPKLRPSHMAQALVTMSASLEDVSGTIGHPGPSQNLSQSALERIRWGQLLGDPKHYSCLLGTHPRLAALLDLSGPQIAVLLSARRIAARDDTRASAEDEVDDMRRKESAGGTATTILVPLTYQRIKDEYTTSFVASGRYTTSSDRYPPHVLYRSCLDLMELDIIRLKKEQCGGGALQYGQNDTLTTGTDITHLPLHVNLDWELEFMGALKAGLLQCSTALREWGQKMN